MGLMQLMPETWAALRARYGLGRDAFDAHDNILAGAAFLREMHDRYGSPGFLAAYNAGPGRYEDYRDRHRPLPPETVAYVAALVPFVGDGATDGPVLVAASGPPSWTQAPLFITRSASAEPVDRAPSKQPSSDCAGCHRGARPVGHRTAIRWAVRPRFRSGAETVIAPLSRRCAATSPQSARAFPVRSAASDVPGGYIAAIERDFAGGRGTASFREEGRAGRGGTQKPTDRGRDKRPQGAARSVGCFYWDFSAIRQCAALGRKVRWTHNALPNLAFPHIAGAGDG